MLQAAKILKRKKERNNLLGDKQEKTEISWLCSLLYHIFFFICIFTVQKPDALCNQPAGDNPVCSLSQLSHFLSPVSEQGRGDDWQRQLRRVKNPSMDFRVLLLTTTTTTTPSPLPLFAPAKSILCRDFIDSGKGVVIQQSMSVSVQWKEGWRHAGSGPH